MRGIRAGALHHTDADALSISVCLPAIFSLICLCLVIATEQSDAIFNSIRDALAEAESSGDDRGSGSLNVGAAFILLVLGVAFSMLSAACVSIELWKRTEGGHLNAFSLQSNPESGILESHVSMYQQM
jgi:hypothetical protein